MLRSFAQHGTIIGMVKYKNYWEQFTAVVNKSPSLAVAAKRLKKDAHYVSCNASRLRRLGYNVKKFPVGAKLKKAEVR